GAVVARGREWAPSGRYGGGAGLAGGLEALEPGAPVTLPPRPRSWRRSTSLMVAMTTLALGIALASALRLSRSAGRNVPHESTDWIPSVPIPPVPPVPPATRHAPGLDADAEKIARDVRKQLELSIPREGSRGLIA